MNSKKANFKKSREAIDFQIVLKLEDIAQCVSMSKTHTNNWRRCNFPSFDNFEIYIYIEFMVLIVMINEDKKEAVETK